MTVSNYKFNFKRDNVVSFLKKCRNNNLTIGVYLFTAIYFLIISNSLEYLRVASRIISLRGDIKINPGAKSNALNRCFRYVNGI